MRINRFIAQATGMSRRTADAVLADGRVLLDGVQASAGAQVEAHSHVTLDGKPLAAVAATTTIMLNKPAGYVCSRNGQGSRTIYELLPQQLQQLKAVGRLDKNSSGLLLLTNDGVLAQALTHPKYHKTKIYEIVLDKPLAPLHRQMVAEFGVQLEDGPSKFALERLRDRDDTRWRVTMHEGRNRQIRRTFDALGYDVTKLHRTQFGEYKLTRDLRVGSMKPLS
jgi:23S rRNA pseudouridine2605 synthase